MFSIMIMIKFLSLALIVLLFNALAIRKQTMLRVLLSLTATTVELGYLIFLIVHRIRPIRFSICAIVFAFLLIENIRQFVKLRTDSKQQSDTD